MSRIAATVLLLASLTSAWAQSGNSVISGIIRDATEAPVPSTQVRITNIETGVQTSTVSNDVGLYRANALPPGNYRIEVDAAGFDHLNRGPIVLQVSQTLAVDLKLQVGQQSQSILVSESAPVTETQSSQVSQVVDQQMVAGLPLPNRAASSLAALAPGVVMIDTGAGTAENYPVFSVAGGRGRNQNFILDGGSANNAVGLTRPQQMTSLPLDAMQEFRVIANNYSAEYGHSTGGVITMSTKSGSNQYHGSLFESLQNTVFNARNFFAAKRPASRLNQYGGSFGGPIRKDKTHFFVTWERAAQLSSDTIKSTVPTLLNRQGDFSDLRSSSGKPMLIYDPSTTVGTSRAPFAGNIIPITRFDPVALTSLAYFPLPNATGTLTNANNFAGSSANILSRNIVVGRLDHQFNSSNVFTARYYINSASVNDSGTYGIPVSDPVSDINDVRVQSALASFTHIFSPTLTNTGSFSYMRRSFIDSRPGAGQNFAGKIGLTGVSNVAFPSFTIPGYGVPAGIVAGTVTVPTTGAALGNPGGIARIQTPSWINKFSIHSHG